MRSNSIAAAHPSSNSYAEDGQAGEVLARWRERQAGGRYEVGFELGDHRDQDPEQAAVDDVQLPRYSSIFGG